MLKKYFPEKKCLKFFSPLRGENCLKKCFKKNWPLRGKKMLKKLLKKIAASRRKMLKNCLKHFGFGWISLLFLKDFLFFALRAENCLNFAYKCFKKSPLRGENCFKNCLKNNLTQNYFKNIFAASRRKLLNKMLKNFDVLQKMLKKFAASRRKMLKKPF